MMRKYRKTFLVFALALILLPHVAALASANGEYYAEFLPYWGNNPPLIPCTGMDCRSACDFIYLAQHIFQFAITLGLFAFAPLFVAIGGLMVLLGGASEGLISTGKSILRGTIIGIVFILIAYVVMYVLIQVFGVSGSVGGFGTGIQCNFPLLHI